MICSADERWNIFSIPYRFLQIRDVKDLNAQITSSRVGEGLAPPEYSVKLKPCGEIAKEQLQLIENRFPSVSIKDFVIMPDHIHALIFLHKKAGGASPSPTALLVASWAAVGFAFTISDNICFLSLMHIVIKYTPEEL